MTKNIQDYIEQFPDDIYLHYHAPRYSTLVDLVNRNYRRGGRILDIGRSRLTEIVSDSFETPVDTLGFQPDSHATSSSHYHFDLNHCQTVELWRRDLAPYDLIIFAEVIEHLYTSPNLVLGFIYSITSKGGCVLLQTPNAVALHKRLKMLFGKNPYEKIRENNVNPGHFREYTKSEIIEYSKNAGFQVKTFLYGNYFDYRFSAAALSLKNYKGIFRFFNFMYSLCPGSFKPGMTLVLVKE